MGAFKSFILISVLILFQAVCVSSALADLPPGFPADDCDCIIELRDAAPLMARKGYDEALIGVTGLLGGGDITRLLTEPSFSASGVLHGSLLAGSSIGARAAKDDDGLEWIAWIDSVQGREDERRKLIRELAPVRGLEGMVVPDLGITLVEVGGGLLVCSNPPGELRDRAVEGMGAGVRVRRCDARDAVTQDAPFIITFQNEQPPGGSSCLAAMLVDGSVEIEYRGRFEVGPLVPPGIQRRLDVEVLDRLPEDVIVAIVEHSDAGIVPGEEMIFRLLPYLAEPELPDERRSRRLVVVSEAPPDPSLPDDLRMPAFAVAIEVDGPGASSRRQDLKVLASLNNLRNRLGSRAGLQHLPKPDSFPEEGTRTIYTRALFDPALEGHPLARCVSVNWCQTGGGSCWQLYATTPELADAVASSLEAESSGVSCLAASHAGRLDADRAVEHLGSWLAMAGAFVGEGRAADFSSGITSISEVLRNVSSIDWSITVPDDLSVDAQVRLRPATDGVSRR